MLGPRCFPPAPRAPRGPRDRVRTPVVWGAVGNLNFAVFAMAVRFVDAAVVAAISQLWTLLNVLLLNRLGRLLAVGNHRPHRIAPRQALLAGVAFAGAVLVVLSGTAHVGYSDWVWRSSRRSCGLLLSPSAPAWGPQRSGWPGKLSTA